MQQAGPERVISVNFSFLTKPALLKYNLCIINVTHYKDTIDFSFSEFIHLCTNSAIRFLNTSMDLKRCLCLFTPYSHLWPQQLPVYIVSIILHLTEISSKWNHPLCGLCIWLLHLVSPFQNIIKNMGHWTWWSWEPLPCDIFQLGHGNLLLNYFQVISFITQLIKSPPAVQVSACKAGDPGSIPRSGRSPGEGNGNPLQYSHLRNPMDRGAWQAIDHGVIRVGHDLMPKLPPPHQSELLSHAWFSATPQGSSVHGVLQERIQGWFVISFSRGSSWPRDRTRGSCTAGRFSTDGATRDYLWNLKYATN